MGNLMNVLDKENISLKLLGIKTIIYFTPNKFEHLETNPEFSCFHFEMKEHEKPLVDFD